MTLDISTSRENVPLRLFLKKIIIFNVNIAALHITLLYTGSTVNTVVAKLPSPSTSLLVSIVIFWTTGHPEETIQQVIRIRFNSFFELNLWEDPDPYW
jgi:hypothetical protein